MNRAIRSTVDIFVSFRVSMINVGPLYILSAGPHDIIMNRVSSHKSSLSNFGDRSVTFHREVIAPMTCRPRKSARADLHRLFGPCAPTAPARPNDDARRTL